MCQDFVFCRLCFSPVAFPNQTQANVVCVVYDVTDEDTINKVKNFQTSVSKAPCYNYLKVQSVTFFLSDKVTVNKQLLSVS